MTDGIKPSDTQIEEAIDAGAIAPEELARRRAIAGATDDADASHEGGMGAQGGAVDFGNPKNIADI